MLFLWGLLAAERAKVGTGLAILSGLVYTALGVAIVALKLALVH